jgi:pimeloyl-ACP methyl ester carboxylesterase
MARRARFYREVYDLFDDIQKQPDGVARLGDRSQMIAAQDRTIRLPDGRYLGFAEYGAAAGKTLLYFHGHPGARFEARFLAEAASRANIRLIGIDRPGMGMSTYQRARRLLDWPRDVVAFADNLGLDLFAVVGFSGGGPYALACRQAIPGRLISCGVISGVGLTGFVLSFLAAWLPWLMLPLARRRFFLNDEQALRTLTRVSQRWPEPDRKALEVTGVKQLMAASLVEGLRPGARGAARDGALLGRPWGFTLAQLEFPPTHLWYGELDEQVPISRARALAQQVPAAKTRFYPAEAHISTIVNCSGEIVRALVGE